MSFKHLTLFLCTVCDVPVPLCNNVSCHYVSALRFCDRFSPDWKLRLQPPHHWLLHLPAATLSERGRPPVPAATARTADTGDPRLSPGPREDTGTHLSHLRTHLYKVFTHLTHTVLVTALMHVMVSEFSHFYPIHTTPAAYVMSWVTVSAEQRLNLCLIHL